ncbi:MAG: hypothetical protein ACRD68_05380, partial [Pyrinomonadaceae bacterium]
VTIRGNYFRNSGSDQDLDMEPTGGLDDLGPYQVEIDNNLFERVKPGLTVALGASKTQPSDGLRFTNNTIRSASPGIAEGGCIFVYKANNTLIANNTIIGAQRCTPFSAQKVVGMQVINNYFEGYTNVADGDTGVFRPRPVIAVSEDIVNRGDTDICGAPPKPEPCPYFIHYPEQITLRGNRVVQHVQHSPAVSLSNADQLVVADNRITHTHQLPPAGAYDADDPAFRPRGVNISFGVQNLPSYGYYLNEKTALANWSLTGNNLSQLADGIRIAPIKAGIGLGSVVVSGNVFNTAQSSPQGILLAGANAAPDEGFVKYLKVDSNQFGCGFPAGRTLPGWPPPLPPNAFVRPSGQAHTGNIGFRVACQKQP